MTQNTYCILCTECIKTCPKDNLSLNLRPWGEDLKSESKLRTDEAILSLILLSMTAFHGLTMTPLWNELIESTRRLTADLADLCATGGGDGLPAAHGRHAHRGGALVAVR